MQISIVIQDFPMKLTSRFCDEVRKYADVSIAFAKDGSTRVYLDSTDIVKIQEVCIVCDKYAIPADTNFDEEHEEQYSSQ